MKKYLSFALMIAFIMFISGGFASAEETTETTETTTTETEQKGVPAFDPIPGKRDAGVLERIKAEKDALRAKLSESKEQRNEVKAQREENKEKIKEEREVLKNEIKEKRAEFQTEVKEDSAEFKAKRMADREAFKKEVQAKRDEFKAKLSTEREAFKKEVEAKKAEFKANIVEKRADFRAKAVEIAGVRSEGLIKEITALQGKVSARIDSLKAKGVDTTEVEEYLNLSKEKLTSAEAKIAEVKALIPTTDEKVTAEVFEQIKVGTREAKDLLKESHNALKEAVSAIKGLKVTTTPATDTSSTATTAN